MLSGRSRLPRRGTQQFFRNRLSRRSACAAWRSSIVSVSRLAIEDLDTCRIWQCSHQSFTTAARPARGGHRAHRDPDGADARLGADGRLRRRHHRRHRARAASTATRRRRTPRRTPGSSSSRPICRRCSRPTFRRARRRLPALRATPPALPGFSVHRPGRRSGPATGSTPRFADGTGNPLPEDPVNGSTITAGPYQGFRGIITPYDITVTARVAGGRRGSADAAHAADRRDSGVPVRHVLGDRPGVPRRRRSFDFGGRVHTNGNLFLAAADGGTLTLADRITAVKDVIRTHLPNGLPTTTATPAPSGFRRSIATQPGHQHLPQPGADRGQPHRDDSADADADRAERTRTGRGCRSAPMRATSATATPARSGSICRSSPTSTATARPTRSRSS